MPKRLHVHLLPDLVDPADLADAAVVVIDVLRASTSITHALAAGAREVIPCLEVDEARDMAANLPREAVVLGGERGGLPIDGFDLGNSPREYTTESVGGRTVVFTTTNGTRAMHRCKQAARVLIGGFVNAAAVIGRCKVESAVHLMCAGTRGSISRDDALVAGLLVCRLIAEDATAFSLNDEAALVRDAWQAAVGPDVLSPAPEKIAAQLHDTQAGHNVASIGQAADIDAATALDRLGHVPQLDTQRWTIRLP